MAAGRDKRERDLPEGVYRHRSRYRVVVYVGIDPVTGRQGRKTGTADMPREAVKLRARLLTEVGQGRHKGWQAHRRRPAGALHPPAGGHRALPVLDRQGPPNGRHDHQSEDRAPGGRQARRGRIQCPL